MVSNSEAFLLVVGMFWGLEAYSPSTFWGQNANRPVRCASNQQLLTTNDFDVFGSSFKCLVRLRSCQFRPLSLATHGAGGGPGPLDPMKG